MSAIMRVARLSRHLSPVQTTATGSFAGKACIVTGAASGVGRAAAQLLCEAGAKVLLVDLDAKACHAAAEDLAQYGAVAEVGDISSEEDNARFCEACLRQFGALDIFLANAGVLPPWQTAAESTAGSFERCLKTNLVGPFLGIKYASEVMRERGGGSIVVTTSIAALRVDMAPLEYHAAKAGILGLVRAAQDQLLEHGVRVNCVAPGGINTPLITKVPMALYRRGLRIDGYDMEKFPLCEPEEVARVLVFLASNEASAIRGQCIVADKAYTNSMGTKLVPVKKKC